MRKKSNVIQLDAEETFDRFEEVEVIEVEAEEIRTTQRPHTPEKPQSSNYSHHNHYNEDYVSPELPKGTEPYSSTKAKTFMMLFSLSLIALTASFVQTTQSKIDHVKTERLTMVEQADRAKNEKVALTLDMMSMNTKKFEDSVAQMGQVVENRKALIEVETALRGSTGLSDKKARELLLRAGYKPSQLDEERITEFKDKYKNVDGDVDFARDIAGDIVQEEVESFVHKLKLLNNVGEYIYNRASE